MSASRPWIEICLKQEPVAYAPLDAFPESAGAECVFFGRTRLETSEVHGRLVRLSYDAYEPMAVSVMKELAAEAVTRFGCTAIRLHHALGEVAPGQASVLVQVACGHRGASFEACRFLIDELKAKVPIWKREEWADGSTWSTGMPVQTEVAE